MALQEGGMARPYAQPFPHPVAEDEARVEHRHDRALTRHEFAVDPDEDALVARVVLEVVRAVSHVRNPTTTGRRRTAPPSPLILGSFLRHPRIQRESQRGSWNPS